MRFILGVASFLAAPAFVTLSFTGWLRSLKSRLPLWRSGLSLASMLLILLPWCFILVNAVLSLGRRPQSSLSIREEMFWGTLAVSFLMSFALEGKPRLYELWAVFSICVFMRTIMYF